MATESYKGCYISHQINHLQTNSAVENRIPVTKGASVARRRKRNSEFSPSEFWQYVDRRGADECWLWTDTVLARNGYGSFWHPVLRRTMSAHRVAWILTHGEIPKGLEVCHRCDRPACCNPACLWLGTHLQNMQDMVAKGRRSTVAHSPKGRPWSPEQRRKIVAKRRLRAAQQIAARDQKGRTVAS